MNAQLHSYGLTDREVLGRLLHSVSQPLTALHCLLETSAVKKRRRSQTADEIRIALEQTDRVIEIVRLMREYLDSEPKQHPVGQHAERPIVGSPSKSFSK